MQETNAPPAPGASPPDAGASSARLRAAWFAAVIAGLLAGLALYLPWDTFWDMALRRMAASLPEARITWQGIDRASPLGFRVNGLVAGSPRWPVSPRLQSLEVRLGVSPRLSMKADTGGLELRMVVLDTGDFDVRGAANLACLGRRDIVGRLDVRAEGRFDRAAAVLEKGLLDLRGKALQFPGGLWLGEAALAMDYADGALSIRNFTLREPMQVRGRGTVSLKPGQFLASPYVFDGEVLNGRESAPFQSRGQLGDILGETPQPE
jgi:hypothetical protein